MIKMCIVGTLLALGFLVFAQEKLTITPPSHDEVMAIMNAEIDEARTQSALNQAAADAIAKLPEKAAHDAAMQRLNQTIDQVFISRKITGKDATLCHGPREGVCSGVKPGEIALLPNPKPEAKK